MFDIIPLIIILVTLTVIIVIAVRKFPMLAALDVETIQSEKEAIIKEQIIGKRMKRNIIRYYSKLANLSKPLFAWLFSLLSSFYKKLLDFKENYNKQEKTISGPNDIESLLSKADEAQRDERFEEAEKRYIEIISVDSQNLRAFRGLAKLYQQKKQYQEAKQTYEHILRLLEHEEVRQQTVVPGSTAATDNSYVAAIYFDLASSAKDNEEYRAAQAAINKACELEANNPRYLDMKLEISIMNKDKIAAVDALAKLREANPENGKIGEFETKIREL
jgi:tetratricopeptide (TPR) repeat protein